MDWIAQINAWLDEHGLYPEVEAKQVAGKPSIFVLSDTQESTAYRSPEGCYRALTLLSEDTDYEGVGQELATNILPDEEQEQVEYQSGGGYLWIG